MSNKENARKYFFLKIWSHNNISLIYKIVFDTKIITFFTQRKTITIFHKTSIIYLLRIKNNDFWFYQSNIFPLLFNDFPLYASHFAINCFYCYFFFLWLALFVIFYYKCCLLFTNFQTTYTFSLFCKESYYLYNFIIRV